jgi:outer membrane protein assembly factor BamB
MGIDFLNGKHVWTRDINKEYGWNDHVYLNDSTLMVVAAGLHTINIYTGKGWDYNTITGKIVKNRASSSSNSYDAGAFMAGMLFGLVGAIIYSAIVSDHGILNTTISNELVRDFVSNTLLDADFCYLASQEQLVKLDNNSGEIIWKHTFKKNIASKSTLFMDDDFVYMINSGYALRDDVKLYYGLPFIAAFNKQTGEQKYFSLYKKHGVFIDYKIIDNNIYLLFRNQIIKHNLETGTYVLCKIYGKESFNELTHFVENNTFIISKEGDLLNPIQSDLTNFYLNTNQNKIFSIDNNLNIINTISYKETLDNILHYKGHNFIANDEKTFILNSNGKIIAKLNVSSNAFISNDVLYEKKDNSFMAIDLKTIIN